MATRNIVPRATGEGQIGTSAKTWSAGYFNDIAVTNGVTASTFTGDLTGDVTGDVTGNVTGDVTGDLTGNVTGNVTGDLTGNVTGDVTGNADTATSATKDGLGNNIANTYQPAVVGAVIAFAGSTSPAGWLLCDGSAVSRTDYAALYAVIGDTYGAGDGTSTFNLPNLTDRFIQGNATVGTVKAAGLPNITGRGWNVGGGSASDWSGAFKQTEVNPVGQTSGSGLGGGYIDFNASLSNSIYGKSSTVQPPAVTMRYIIKY